jgi:YHS domain-containing protein
MKALTFLAAGALAVSIDAAAAQHEGHQMPMAAQPAAAMDPAQCATNARQARDAAQAAVRRLEGARQNNDPAAMRTAVDDLQSALGFIQARLEACTAPPPAAAMPQTSGVRETPMMQPGATSPAPAAPAGGMAAMDHSNMAGMDHSKMNMPAGSATAAGKVPDPVCKTPVDPKSAPKTDYKGKTYYFCSESDRQKFLANPAKYLKDNPK